MHVVLSKQNLQRALARCASVARFGSSVHPFTSKVLLTASQGNQVLQLFATDVMMQIDTAAAATIKQPGVAAVECKRLVEVIGVMPQGEIHLTVKGDRLLVTGTGSRKFSLPTVDPQLMPTPAEPAESAPALTLKSSVFASLVSRLKPTIDPKTELHQRHLFGMYLEAEGSVLHAVTGSGHGMSRVQVQLAQPVRMLWSCIVPEPALNVFSSLCAEHESVKMLLEGPSLFLETPDTLCGVQLPIDKFVPWRPLLESLSRRQVARVHLLDLQEALRGVMAARQDASSAVKVVTQDHKLNIELARSECEATDEIAVESLCDGQQRFVIMPDLFQIALKAVGSDFFLELDGPTDPVVLSSDDFLGIVMPIMPGGYFEDDPAPPPATES